MFETVALIVSFIFAGIGCWSLRVSGREFREALTLRDESIETREEIIRMLDQASEAEEG